MPNPNLTRAHLKAGKGGKRDGAGRKTKAEEDRVQKLARKLLDSPAHQATLRQKIDDMTIHPSIYVAYLYYAHGKPKETIETKQIIPVRIVHQYEDEKPKPDETA